jgi:hypothetical protein
LPVSFSPRIPATTPTRMVSESTRYTQPSLYEATRRPPPNAPFSIGSRPFTRVSSAPATMAHPIASSAPRVGTIRAPSGLGARFSIPSQNGDIQEEASPASSLLSSPVLSPPGPRSAFSRSKTGAIEMNSSLDAGINQTSVEIMAARNSLTR